MSANRFTLIVEDRIDANGEVLANRKRQRFNDRNVLIETAKEIKSSENLDVPLYYYDRGTDTFYGLDGYEVSEQDKEEFKLNFSQN